MNVFFNWALCYHVTASCFTPLRSGGADRDTEQILRDGEGRAMIQGASLAGAFRNWVTEVYDTEQAEALFGAQRHESSIVVSDGIFDAAAAVTVRPRLKINEKTGTAAGRFKFDIAHVSPKSVFHFELTWLGTEPPQEAAEIIEQMLAAMNQGDIRLGGQKSNGFGRVKLTVQKRCYNMTREQDRNAWMENSWDGQDMELPQLKHAERVVFTVRAYAPRILVKAGAPLYKSGMRVTEHLRERSWPVIPGSSVKGTILSRVRSIAKYLNVSEDILHEAFGRSALKTVPVHEDNGKPCRFCFEDIYPQKEHRDQIARIRIDRFTGGVIRGALFKEEIVSGDVVLRISSPSDYPQACGLMLYALRDLGLGLYNLGSTGSIGRGYLDVSTIIASFGEKKAVLTFDPDHSMTLDDPDGLAQSWLASLGGRS